MLGMDLDEGQEGDMQQEMCDEPMESQKEDKLNETLEGQLTRMETHIRHLSHN